MEENCIEKFDMESSRQARTDESLIDFIWYKLYDNHLIFLYRINGQPNCELIRTTALKDISQQKNLYCKNNTNKTKTHFFANCIE